MDDAIGKAKGGLARMEGTTKKERSALGKKGAAARWGTGPVKEVTHGSEDHPLQIGDIQIPCYVLDDETRVLSQRGLQTGIGMSISGGSFGEQRMAGFIDGLGQKGVNIKDLSSRIRNPILFKLPGGGRSYGFEATILADICDAVLDARKIKGALHHQQEHIADRCEILLRGFARVGIIALVDEATGFQRDRTRDALSRILEAFIAKELQPWVRTFPGEYYQEMFRLRGLKYDAASVKRPPYFGHLTNDIVYDRLAPEVLKELKTKVPRNEEGRPKAKFSQMLTRNVGYPKLREHLGAVVATMRLSRDWHDFKEKLDRNYRRYSGPTQGSFDFGDDEGTGL
ncbi:MAG TPA: P63C domain-containing protein [Pseudolabrys sp.]|nr:P63C domain-containing protein [Pseudolabrys sp.]